MAKFTINDSNNLVRVFRAPDAYPSGFCFGGGLPLNFTMVDWFNAVIPMDLAEYPNKEKILEGEEVEKHRQAICEFLVKKVYYDPNKIFFAITKYGDVFRVEENRE